LNLDKTDLQENIELREEIRKSTGTPNPAFGFEHDKPTLDLPRDL